MFNSLVLLRILDKFAFIYTMLGVFFFPFVYQASYLFGLLIFIQVSVLLYWKVCDHFHYYSFWSSLFFLFAIEITFLYICMQVR